MAEIAEGGGGGGGKHGKKKAKKGVARMDMTPMVDLAFLLLTFFILSTSLSKPKTMEIIYPKEEKEKDNQTKVADELATTVLIGEEDDAVFYYSGKFKPDSTELILSSFSKDGLRTVLLDNKKNCGVSGACAFMVIISIYGHGQSRFGQIQRPAVFGLRACGFERKTQHTRDQR